MERQTQEVLAKSTQLARAAACLDEARWGLRSCNRRGSNGDTGLRFNVERQSWTLAQVAIAADGQHPEACEHERTRFGD